MSFYWVNIYTEEVYLEEKRIQPKHIDLCVLINTDNPQKAYKIARKLYEGKTLEIFLHGKKHG
jgi:hypothetical protein